MPGQYQNTGGNAIQATLQTNLNGDGGPIKLANQNGFHNVAMGQQAGGAIAGANAPGVTTDKRSDCVVIAVMQGDGQGNWQRFYFTHLNGGQWTSSNQQLFNQSITTPANAWVAMESNAFSGMETLLEDMNKGNPNGNIPGGRLLQYKTKGSTFGMSLQNAAIGEQ